jgi:hypothetical protein
MVRGHRGVTWQIQVMRLHSDQVMGQIEILEIKFFFLPHRNIAHIGRNT